MNNKQGLILSVIALCLSMFNAGLIVSKHYYKHQISRLEQQVVELEERDPIIIYQVDNAGGIMLGKISNKEIIEGRYTVEVGTYGKFLVTKEQYDSLTIGDDAPNYLKKRGIESNQVPGENNE